MSYCRFSSDAFRCDVYAYGDVSGGYTIHVAARKRLVPDDFPDPLATMVEMVDADPATAIARYNDLNAAMVAFPFVDLTAPSAGQTFHCADLEDFKAKMLDLRAEGLRFPDDVLDEIDAELRAEETMSTPG